jgi:GTP-binding protein Era
MMTPMPADSRCGYVAIVGAPNAGKSTLLNRLVGSKVAIVTPKAQTTRARIVAIAMAPPAQIVFVDTPGIFQPKRRLEQALVNAAWAGAHDADLVVLLVDALRGVDKDVQLIIDGLKRAGPQSGPQRNTGRSAILALNKIHAAPKEKLLTLTSAINAQGNISDTFMISALTGDGVEDLKTHLARAVPPGPWLYPEDHLTDISERTLAAEITREKLFMRLHQELPYASTVETVDWRDQADGSARVEQVIYVLRDSQKPIVLGKGGQTIKAIGAAARAEMETVFGRRMHVFLEVKVRANWHDEPERYRAMGLEFPK